MPMKKVNFKSDREIEDSAKKPIEIKSRSYNPFQLDGLADCLQCSNVIRPACDLGVKTPCDVNCFMVTEHKKIHEYCPHYAGFECKEGYPVSLLDYMPCPKYDGPKVICEIHIRDKKGKWHLAARTK